MSSHNPLIYTFPRDGESTADPEQRDPSSRAPGDNSPQPANPLFPTSISSLLTNLGTEDAIVPELVLVVSDPLQIWFDGEHLIETADRHATVGKYYLRTIGEVALSRVEKVENRSGDEVDYEVPQRAQERLANPVDELHTTVCYELTSDRGPYVGESGGPRFLYEGDGSIGSDPPPIPFVRAEELQGGIAADPDSNQTLSDFG